MELLDALHGDQDPYWEIELLILRKLVKKKRPSYCGVHDLPNALLASCENGRLI